MTAYTNLAAYYDTIFPPDPKEMAWLAAQFTGKTMLLDIGCGTGSKTALLATGYNRVIGTDADAAMIAVAQARHNQTGLFFQHISMEELGSAFPDNTFDGLSCIGNTLVHLPDLASIQKFISSAARLLRPASTLVLQILNYDYILHSHIKNLAPIITPTLSFERSYEPQGNHLCFHTVLTVLDSDERLEQRTLLYPVRKAELELMLNQANFCQLRFLSGFCDAPLFPDSMVLTVCAISPASSA